MSNIIKDSVDYTNEIVNKLKNIFEKEIENLKKIHEKEIKKLNDLLKQQKQITKDLENLCIKSDNKIVSQR